MEKYLEEYLIRHCAPTLAGIKISGLFGFYFEAELCLTNSLNSINQLLSPKGIRAEVLRIRGNNALILVYRHSMLLEKLNDENVIAFLESYGYCQGPLHEIINHLKIRLTRNDFPHEIGIFLGYPLHDVAGFINQNGKNSKVAGCWKVYSDEDSAKKLFLKYGKCKNVYMKLFSQGKSFEQLIVAI